MSETKFLDNLASCFEKLPGVGKKTAQRYAYYIIEKMSLDDVKELSNELVKTKENVKHCKICGMLTDLDICHICNNSYRNKEQIMVVRDTKDVLAVEKTAQYNGLYHVLGGLISPLDGITPDNLNIDSLEKRLDNIKEVIIATNPTRDGETTALYLAKLLAKKNINTSRIANGLPIGSNIDYADELTLLKSLEGRKKI